MLLLVKLRNGIELTWESLDAQERRLFVVGVCYLIGAAVAAVVRGTGESERDRLVREVADELERRNRA